MRNPSSTSCFKFGIRFLFKLHWYQNKAKTNRFLTSNQSFNAGGVPFQKTCLVSVLPRVIRLTLGLHLFQALADALCVNKTITHLYLGSNQIGGAGMKVWWVERLEEVVWEWMDPGASMEVMGSLWPHLIRGFKIVEPWTFQGLIGFWTVCLRTWFRHCSWTWTGW